MEEIKVGEYVRTKYGICQLKSFEKHYTKRRTGEIENYILFDKSWYIDKYSFPPCYPTDEELEIIKKDIVNHSFNIMDLLEDEDIVILEYYVKKYARRITRKFEINKIDETVCFENCHCNFIYNLQEKRWLDGKGYNPKIKRIVTKEQFKSVEYEV